MGYDALVVGAGFAGSVVAERLARRHRKRVLVIDRRSHVGGNAYDFMNEAGIRVHAYGPHIFHTNSKSVFDYLSEYTAWRPYEHRVRACVRGRLVPFPINRTTLNELFGLQLHDEGAARAFYADLAEAGFRPHNAEQQLRQSIGSELYELFYRGYTRKHWGLDASELEASVTARVPARTNMDDRYFPDRFQAMPADGYAALFRRLLSDRRIDVRTDVEYARVRSEVDYGQLVYTGGIDSYFDMQYGSLPYRSVRFEFETLPMAQYQPIATVNFPDERIPFTRITEFKHVTGQEHEATAIVREYPQSDGPPFYPVPRAANRALYERYAVLGRATPAVSFLGRLGSYRYYDMDQVVAQALKAADRIASSMSVARRPATVVGSSAVSS
jgi:UDP-galactopyranose mutase